MQLEKFEFANEFFYKKGVCVSPQVVAELLDAFEEKFNSTAQGGPTNSRVMPCEAYTALVGKVCAVKGVTCTTQCGIRTA